MSSDRLSLDNRNRLSWWFPRIPPSINIPKTTVVTFDGGPNGLIGLLDGEVVPEFSLLCEKIKVAATDVGFPFFLRTDFLSGKHNWRRTCCVSSVVDIPSHVCGLVEDSCLADMEGFPIDRFAVREMLPTIPAFWAFRGDMPITKERRYFVKDGKVTCHHPYWPHKSFELPSDTSLGGGVIARTTCDDWRRVLDDLNVETEDEVLLLSGLSEEVGIAIGGEWSIDWLWSNQRGKWYLTDMAEAGHSFHWHGCQSVSGENS